MKPTRILAALCALTLVAGAGSVQAADKPEDLIKARQAAYAFMAWNMGRIRASVDAPTYDKETVTRAANAIQAVANSGLGALYAPGTEKGTGFLPTQIKPEALQPQSGARIGQLATDFNREANVLANVAATGDAAAVKAQLGKLGGTCKACHEEFRLKLR